MGASKPKSADSPSGEPIEGVGTDPGGGPWPDIPVVVGLLLVLVSAIGSGFGLMRARKARAARQRGAESIA